MVNRKFALSIAFLLVTLACGMHEDEQGKHDWFKEGIGYVTAAVFPSGMKQQRHVVVTSEQGVVASIAHAQGTVRWRHFLSARDPGVCIAAGDNFVAVVSASGVVHKFDARSGMVQSTYQVRVNAAFKPTCFWSAQGFNVVTAFGSIVTLYEGIKAATIDLKSAHPIAAMSASSSFVFATTEDRNLFAVDVKTLAIVGKPVIGVNTISGAVGTRAVADGRVVVVHEGEVTLASTSEPSASTTLALSGETITAIGNVNGASVKVLSSNGDQSRDEFSFHVDGTKDVIRCITVDMERNGKLLVQSFSGQLVLLGVSGDSKGVKWIRNEATADTQSIVFANYPQRQVDDKFGFHQIIVQASSRGFVTATRTIDGSVLWSAALSEVATAVADVKFSHLITGVSDVAAVFTGRSATVFVLLDPVGGAVVSTKLVPGKAVHAAPLHDGYECVHLSSGGGMQRHLIGNTSAPSKTPATSHFFTVDREDGVLKGFRVTGTTVTNTWTVNLGSRLVSVAGSEGPAVAKSVQNMKPVMKSGAQSPEVRRKYPTVNTVAVGVIQSARDSEDNVSQQLVITLIDTVSGSILATGSHSHAAEPVSMIVVEHAVVFHYFQTKKMSHYVGVWELFAGGAKAEAYSPGTLTNPSLVIFSLVGSKKRSVSSAAAVPPLVVSNYLVFPGHVRLMKSTFTDEGIARKQILFVTQQGQIFSVDLRLLLSSPPAPIQGSLPIMPTSIVSYKHAVHGVTKAAVSTTILESTTHAVFSGVDQFYIRVVGGKAFDRLNDDFNRSLLITICGALSIAALAFRALTRRKLLKQMWA